MQTIKSKTKTGTPGSNGHSKQAAGENQPLLDFCGSDFHLWWPCSTRAHTG